MFENVNREQRGGVARSFEAWQSAKVPGGALAALKLEAEILRAVVSGKPVPSECEALARQTAEQDSPVFDRSTAKMGSVKRELHASLEAEVAALREKTGAPIMPGRPGALIGQAGHCPFVEYLAKLPSTGALPAAKAPSKLAVALARIAELEAQLAATKTAAVPALAVAA